MLDPLPVDWDIRTLSSGTRVTEAIDKHHSGQQSGREDPSRKASCRPSVERVAGNYASFFPAFLNPRSASIPFLSFLAASRVARNLRLEEE
jgi:hypothetical protein